MSTLPLTAHPAPDSIVAWLPAGPVTRDAFLAHVACLAALLPQGGEVLNACQDRYHFLVGLAAAVVKGRVSLLPATVTPETVTRLKAQHPQLICVHDGHNGAIDLPALAVPPMPAAGSRLAVPQIPVDQVVAHVYTSGSTALPVTHCKHWGPLVANARAAAERLHADGHALIGTVPPQHMYGFESTILIGLLGGAASWSGRPFYPADIAAAIAAVPRPRALVTTPFHLRALLDAAVAVPPLDFILSATAPLGEELAARAEAVLGAPLLEIYGCTETGQLATRQATAGPAWHLLGECRLSAEADTHLASGGHIEGVVALSDRLEVLDDTHFLLHGRHADLVNIAGKRTSIAYLTQQLLSLPGVVDGAFFMPDEAGPAHITRLAACVVAPGVDRAELLAALRLRIDAVFLPRPLILTDHLPRNAASKLTRGSLLELLATRGHGS